MRTILAFTIVGLGVASAAGCADDDPDPLQPCPDAGAQAGAPGEPSDPDAGEPSEVDDAPCAAYVATVGACGLLSGTHIGGCDNTDPKTKCVAACTLQATCKQINGHLCRGAINSYAGCLNECQYNFINPDFDCGDGTTVPGLERCDGVKDCANGADEECPPGKFACDTGVQIPEGWHCDHHPDCLAGEDEFDCPYRPRFSCDDGSTIVLEGECNGSADCPGGEDETGCAVLTCQ